MNTTLSAPDTEALPDDDPAHEGEPIPAEGLPADADDEPNDEPADDDEPNDEPSDEPADEPAPEARGPQTEKEIEAAFDKLDREAKRHTSRISEIMGDDATVLLPCELCEPTMQGFRFPEVPYGDPREPLYAVLAAGDPGSYATAPDAAICQACNGLGQVLTGSKVPEHVTKLCSRCTGTGWTLPSAPAPAAPLNGDANGHVEPSPSAMPQLPQTDYLNRPYGHPNYGKFTQYMTPDEIALDVRDGFGNG